MSDDVRTTAIVTDAFLDLRPSEPMLPRLVKGLFGERQHGRWRTTQDNLYALVALTHYVKSRPSGSVTVDATLGDKTVLSGDFRGKNTHIRRASVPAGRRRSLRRRRSRSTRTAARCSTRRCCASGATSPTRRPTKTSSPSGASTSTRRPRRRSIPKKGVKVGSIVRVRVTVSSPEWRNHLAVDDPVPAGLEPVNTRLATSGARPQEGASRHERRRAAQISTSGGGPSFREMRDDRVLVFIDDLRPGRRRSNTWPARRRRGRSSCPGRRPRRCTSRRSRRGPCRARSW